MTLYLCYKLVMKSRVSRVFKITTWPLTVYFFLFISQLHAEESALIESFKDSEIFRSSYSDSIKFDQGEDLVPLPKELESFAGEDSKIDLNERNEKGEIKSELSFGMNLVVANFKTEAYSKITESFSFGMQLKTVHGTKYFSHFYCTTNYESSEVSRKSMNLGGYYSIPFATNFGLTAEFSLIDVTNSVTDSLGATRNFYPRSLESLELAVESASSGVLDKYRFFGKILCKKYLEYTREQNKQRVIAFIKDKMMSYLPPIKECGSQSSCENDLAWKEKSLQTLGLSQKADDIKVECRDDLCILVAKLESIGVCSDSIPCEEGFQCMLKFTKVKEYVQTPINLTYSKITILNESYCIPEIQWIAPGLDPEETYGWSDDSSNKEKDEKSEFQKDQTYEWSSSLYNPLDDEIKEREKSQGTKEGLWEVDISWLWPW